MAEMEKLTTSAFGRLLKLGALAGKVGFSLVGEKALGLFLSEDSKEMRMAKSWAKNAEKIAETLGKLKGGAMKIGQMLSIQEAVLPKELSYVLKTLQNNAPTVSHEVMFETLDEDIPHWRTLIQSIEEKAMAAASIGQVHKATLLDGRVVAIKIQYPKINEAIFSDLKNLRRLFELILESVMSENLDHVFAEIEARLSEEIDYTKELERIEEFRAFYKDKPQFVIPQIVRELSSRRVLTTELIEGLSIEDARKRDTHLKDSWGRLLFQSFVGQLLVFRKVQTDPNPANYSFLEDGRLALFDFGSIKELPEWLHAGYMQTLEVCRKGDFFRLPEIAASMKVLLKSGESVPLRHVEVFRNAMAPIFVEKPYRFTSETDPIKKIITFNRENLDELRQITFPGDILFIDRAIAGLVANLTALNAEADWAHELNSVFEN